MTDQEIADRVEDVTAQIQAAIYAAVPFMDRVSIRRVVEDAMESANRARPRPRSPRTGRSHERLAGRARRALPHRRRPPRDVRLPGEGYDEALTDRILAALDARGIAV